MKDIGPYLKLTAVLTLAVLLAYHSPGQSTDGFSGDRTIASD
ncbi:MAG: hypothetical protein ABJF89_05585 [Parasphingorhabdus sp.]